MAWFGIILILYKVGINTPFTRPHRESVDTSKLKNYWQNTSELHFPYNKIKVSHKK